MAFMNSHGCVLEQPWLFLYSYGYDSLLFLVLSVAKPQLTRRAVSR